MPPIIKKTWTSEATELTDRLKRISSADRAVADYYVFKSNGDLLSEIESDYRIRLEVIERAQGKNVYIIQFDETTCSFIIHQIIEQGIRIEDNNEFLFSIRKHDLNEVINRSDGRCILEAPENGHFLSPSGKHTTRFLRLTDAIYSYDALDRISFWLQPYVANASAIVIDTWSLSSIILKTQQLLKIDTPFDCFHEHIKANDTLAIRMLNKLSRRIKKESPILFLVGISSSGTFFRSLQDVLKESNIENGYEAVSIYSFSNTPKSVQSLASLDFEIPWYEENNCIYCNDNIRKTIYEIDAKYYSLRKYEEKTVRFTKKLITESPNASKFIHLFGKHQGVLTVHKDDPNDGLIPRHHAFYIDVSVLMRINDFVSELDIKLIDIEKSFGVPNAVISPPHDAAQAILKHIKTKWPKTKYIPHHNLRGVNQEQRDLIKVSEHLCFIDDVTITGNRIKEYLRALREEFGNDCLGNLKKITWFPLIARPSHTNGIKKIEDSLSNHPWENKIQFLYEIILPDWSNNTDCPWCEEVNVIDKHIGPLWNEPEWYKNRRSLLINTTEGITIDPILSYPFSIPGKLGAGSALGDEGINEMQVLFLVEYGLQILRNNTHNPLGRDDLFSRHVLNWVGHEDSKNNTFDRFSEPFVQSCFLRAVKPNEWSRDVLKKCIDFFASKISMGTNNALIGEALFFLLRIGNKHQLPDCIANRIRDNTNDEVIAILVEKLNKR